MKTTIKNVNSLDNLPIKELEEASTVCSFCGKHFNKSGLAIHLSKAHPNNRGNRNVKKYLNGIEIHKSENPVKNITSDDIDFKRNKNDIYQTLPLKRSFNQQRKQNKMTENGQQNCLHWKKPLKHLLIIVKHLTHNLLCGKDGGTQFAI